MRLSAGILDVLPRDGYSDSDPYVFNPLESKWVAITKEITDLQREAEARGDDPAATAEAVRDLVDGYIDNLRATTDLNEVPLSHYTRFYDDMSNRLDAPNYDKGHGDYEALVCNNCSLYFDDTLEKCPYCGQPKHETVSI